MYLKAGEQPFNFKPSESVLKRRHCNRSLSGFTLLELLTVISIISLLMFILVPVLGKAKEQVKLLLGMSNQKQIVTGVTLFSMDNNGNYPESIATVGFGRRKWEWEEPTMMTACRPRYSQKRRSMSAHLRSYIEKASTFYAPTAPQQYEYMQDAWEAGDNWSNPDTPPPPQLDSVYGTYCFYWNYVGFLGYGVSPFVGPKSTSDGTKRSTILISDYFGYGHWRNEYTYGSGKTGALGSSKKIKGADVTLGTAVSSAFWSLPITGDEIDLDSIKIKLNAGYTDGHVENYSPSEVIPMRVSNLPDGSQTYIGYGSAGIFFLPKKGLK